jgi:transmembrane protein EpsG
VAAYFFYFFVSFSVLAIAFVSRQRKIVVISVSLLFLFLVAFSGFRFNVGTDYFSYDLAHLEYFESGSTYFEPGYNLILKIGSLVHSSQLVFLLAAGLTVGFSLVGIVRLSNYPSLSLMFYVSLPFFYVASFNGVRQFVAISIFVFSLKYLVDKKPWIYFSLIVLACSFHKSAVFLFPLYFVLRLKFGFCVLLAASLFLAIISIFYVDIFNFLGFSGKYFSNFYGSSELDYKNLALLILAVFARAFMPECYVHDLRYRVSLNLLYISCLLYFFAYFMGLPSLVINRFLSYFFVGVLFVVPFFVDRLKGFSSKLIFFFTACFFSWSYFFYTLFSMGGSYNLTPFEFRLPFL